jgi:hypothetical protein
MTKARDLSSLANGVPNSLINLDSAEIPNLDTSKITTGTFADARISNSSVSQHATSFDDNKIINDISTLALRSATSENAIAYNTNSSFVDVFQDGSGIGSTSNVGRSPDEYVSSIFDSADSPTTFSYTGSQQTYTPSGKSKFDAYLWGAGGGAGYNYSGGGGGGRTTTVTAGAGGFASGTVTITGSPTYKMIVGQGGFGQDVVNTTTSTSFGGGGRGAVQSHAGAGGIGGGLSGIFLTSFTHGNSVIIAGGGAGTQGSEPPTGGYSGNGGGTNGQDGGLNTAGGHNANGQGRGGTQSAGGIAGSGDIGTPTAGSALQGGTGSHMSGGGGGGYYGGGGGGHTGSNGGSGSGGGSGYIGHSSVSNGTLEGSTDTTLAGTKTPPQTSNTYYSSGIARGNNGADGGHGKIVIVPYSLSNNATGNFISGAITVSSTNKMGAIITYQDFAGTNALNTDIILQLSADNGSNFTTATLTALPNFSTGIKMAKVNDLSVTAGTQLKYKIIFANQSNGSKVARIRGVSLQY